MSKGLVKRHDTRQGGIQRCRNRVDRKDIQLTATHVHHKRIHQNLLAACNEKMYPKKVSALRTKATKQKLSKPRTHVLTPVSWQLPWPFESFWRPIDFVYSATRPVDASSTRNHY